MSDLLAMSFDCLSSPTLQLNLESEQASLAGWGLGWYPNDDYAASVVKDSGTNDVGQLTSALCDWKRFRSTNFVCKVRGAAKRYNNHNAQPFQKSLWGRDWLFLHNGEIKKAPLRERLGNSHPFLEPVGTTDSELAFCCLLSNMEKLGARRIAAVDYEVLKGWLTEFDSQGSGDFIFCDGQQMIVFHGSNSSKNLHCMRRVPPHAEDQLISNYISLDFTDALDTYRTAFIVSSCQLSGDGWTAMKPGQLFVVRRAGVVWDSHKETPHLSQVNQSTEPQKTTVSQTFFSSQAEQAQSGPMVTTPRSIVRGPDGSQLGYRGYQITHITQYEYSRQVDRSTHVLRLKPIEDRIQEVAHSELSFSVSSQQIQFEDVFGNEGIHVTVEMPYQELEIRTQSKVKVYATVPDDFSSNIRRTSIPLVWMPWQREMMLPYLLPVELPEPQLLELTEFAMSFVEKGDYNLVETLTEMNKQIYEDFKYSPGATTVETTPFDVYTTRKGVCQDFANLFICLARLLNIPARYRVGYIFTGGNYENKIQSDASHAWVEVYLPYVGWRGFDPTNGKTVGQDHIRVACGRNYRDATPTTGTLFKGGGTETLKVTVKVEEIDI